MWVTERFSRGDRRAMLLQTSSQSIKNQGRNSRIVHLQIVGKNEGGHNDSEHWCDLSRHSIGYWNHRFSSTLDQRTLIADQC